MLHNIKNAVKPPVNPVLHRLAPCFSVVPKDLQPRHLLVGPLNEIRKSGLMK